MATLGNMSVWALIDTSIDEAAALSKFIDDLESVDSEDKRWLSAYVTSIRARLAVAQIKIEKERNERDAALVEAATNAQALNNAPV
jgi:predicted aspartyl protease